MKDTWNFLGKSDLTKRKIHEVVMQTAEQDSTWESTERMVKFLDSNYAKADLEQVVSNARNMNSEERTLLLRLL